MRGGGGGGGGHLGGGGGEADQGDVLAGVDGEVEVVQEGVVVVGQGHVVELEQGWGGCGGVGGAP